MYSSPTGRYANGRPRTPLAVLALFALFLGAQHGPTGTPESRPDLAEFLPAFQPTDEHREAGAVVLWKDRTVEVDGDGMMTERHHIAVVVLDEQSASDYAEVMFAYNSFFEEVTLDEARVVLPDGTIKTVSKDAIQIKTQPHGKSFSDLRSLTFALPSLVPGAALEFRISQIGVKPVVEGHWTQRFSFNYVHWGDSGENPRVDPTLHSRLVIRAAGEREIVSAVRSPGAVSQMTREGGFSTYRWDVSRLPAIPVERFSPPLYERLQFVVLGSLTDWNEIDDWAASLMLTAAAPTPALKKIAQEQSSEKVTTHEKVEALFDFVQNEIRYIQADVLRGGLTPHLPEEVLSNGYGDCKDQAVLLVSLLRAAGVEAYPALVGNYYRGDVIRDVPWPYYFDHAIVYVPLPDGDMWIDSSPRSAGCEDLGWSIQDRWAFVVNGEGGRFLKTRSSPPEENEGKFTVDFEFVDGRLMATIVMTASGPLGSSFKSFLRDNPKRNEFIERMILGIYPTARMESTINMDLDFGSGPFRAETRIVLPDAWKPGQTVVRFGGSVRPLLMLFTNLLRLPDPNDRETGFIIGQPSSLVLETHCPSPYEDYHTRTSFVQEAMKSDTLTFRKQLQWEGDAVNARLEFRMDRSRIERSEYEEFYEGIREAVNDSLWTVDFERELEAGTPGAVSADVPLVERSYPGLQVSLPEWETEMETLDPIDGGVVLRPPASLGEIRLSWESAELMPPEEMKQLLTDVLGGVDVEDEGPSTVDGRTAHWLLFRLSGRYLALTFWGCSDTWQANLVTMVDLPKDEMMKLHERILASVQCQEVELEPTFPLFDPPPGLQKEQDLFTLAWSDLEGWGYVFLRGSASREWYDGMPSLPTLLPSVLEMIATEVGIANLQIESGPENRNDRFVWVASGEDLWGPPVRVIAVLWYCPAEDLSFLGLHVGPIEDDLESTLAPLLAARCPGNGTGRESQEPR